MIVTNKEKKRNLPHDKHNKSTRLEPIVGRRIRVRNHLSCWAIGG
jgi:hypothetical protein